VGEGEGESWNDRNVVSSVLDTLFVFGALPRSSTCVHIYQCRTSQSVRKNRTHRRLMHFE
jgi:hypothetical protein